MDMRERRQAIQQHLAEQREKTAGLVSEGVPAGYEPATQFNDSLYALICLQCGANVSRRLADTHSEWHQRLWERLGQG